MKKRITTAAAILSSAIITGFVTATPASAYTLQAYCTTTGAGGGLTVPNFYGATDHIEADMSIYDSLADGHEVKIRLLTKTATNTTHYWAWHGNYGGQGTTQDINTTAKDDSGIFNAGIQVARFEGGTLLNSCTKWTVNG
ncbi:hypothetical protein ACH47Z_23570 [Streptomyces sp. NPDC020192]|uniref:hypothetical protein n=1 Tax=Streptomyces sp. NPDC020192 TaxID=3365066 RepID=UPI00379F4189